MPPSNRIRSLARWALIATAIAMGGALFATVWTANQSVRESSETLVRGHADVLHDGIRFRFTQLGVPRAVDELQPILDAYADDGLRYVAVLDDKGKVTLEVGESVSNRRDLESGILAAVPGVPVELEDADRVRVVYRGVSRPRRFDSSRRMASGRWRGFVIEFEPQLASDLRRASSSALGIGALASGALLLVALGLVRWFWRREAQERQAAHERRLASLGEMSAVLAHEIRNPLASLKGNAQLLERTLERDPDNRDKQRDKAQRVVSEAIRLETLTNNLLEFVRAGEIRREPTDPAALVKATAASVDAARIRVEVAAAPPAWPMDGDRMRQVLTNLLENAVQAGDGEVTASVTESRGRLVFTVRDRGPGIADDAMPRLFEPFFTLRTRGTGLGLAVAKRIVDLHEGSITAGNAADGGAVFRVELPR